MDFLHLETKEVPLRWLLSQKRNNYTIHTFERNDNELVKKAFLAQENNPLQQNFVKLAQKRSGRCRSRI